MELKLLSKPNIAPRILAIAVACSIVSLGLIGGLAPYAPYNFVAGVAVMLLLIGAGLRWYRQAYRFYFSSTHLVMQNALDKRTIPIQQIKELKRDTNIRVKVKRTVMHRWKITFTNEQRQLETRSFLVRANDNAIQEFQSILDQNNR